jgi:hypothetical protein
MCSRTYVTPPTIIDSKIAIGASDFGLGISSVMCMTTSYPMSDSADCRSPSIQDIPSDHPVSFAKSVKTNLASVLLPVARIVILITTTAMIE